MARRVLMRAMATIVLGVFALGLIARLALLAIIDPRSRERRRRLARVRSLRP
jgi:hypothetical protein